MMSGLPKWVRIIGVFVLVLGVGIGGFLVYWEQSTNPVEQPALDALVTSDTAVVDTTEQGWMLFTPVGARPDAMFVFYPGGHVNPQAYAAHVRGIAEAAGIRALIIPMPLDLAVMDVNAMDDVIAAYPGVQTWILGGHSLGGAMACNYLYNHPQAVDGLVLWAAYPADSNDLASYDDVPMLSIHAENDGLATPDDVAQRVPLLPADTGYVLIEGGNHAGFGWYGDQNGDGVRRISGEEQMAQVVAATARFIEGLVE